jgi:hypothetical protein
MAAKFAPVGWTPDTGTRICSKSPAKAGLSRSPLRFVGESQKRQTRKSTLRLAVGFYVVLDFAQRAPPSGAGLAAHRGGYRLTGLADLTPEPAREPRNARRASAASPMHEANLDIAL